MKKILLFLFVAITNLSFAQAPQGVSYQAVAFDASGSAITNGNVGVQVSVLDNSATGTAVYVETHIKTTNAQGLFNLNIGQGTATTGTFSGINWGVNSKFLKVEVDPTGGTTYTTTGISELMSVPYALFAEEASSLLGSGTGSSVIGTDLIQGKSSNFAFNDAQTDIVYAFSSSTGTWSSQAYDNNGYNPSIIESKGNFLFNDTQTDIVYVFNAKTGTWSSQAYDNDGYNPSIITDTLLSNFIFNDAQTDIVYAFSSSTGTWSSQAYDNDGYNPSIIESKGNFLFNDTQTDIVYVFNAKTGTWSSQAYDNDGYNPSITKLNGSFLFNDDQTDIVYIFNSTTGTWSSQAYDNDGYNPSFISSETY